MKIGSTYVITASLEASNVDSIIFTLTNQHTVTKVFPEDVYLNEAGEYVIELNQHETLLLGAGTIKMEAQINFVNKSVVKSTIAEIAFDASLATQIIDGNKPDGSEAEAAELAIDGVVVYGGGGSGGASWGEIGGVITNQKDLIAVLNNKATKADVETMTANYVETHKAELKGDKGDKGDTGADGAKGEQGIQGIQGVKGDKGDKGDKGEAGSNYVITSADYNAIADVVIGKLPMAESEVY